MSVVVFGLVAVSIFTLVVGFILWRTLSADNSDLTQRVEVTVTEHARGVAKGDWRPDYVVHYEYTVDGQLYRDTDISMDGDWNPGDPLFACVKPDDPRKHIPLFKAGKECGDKKLGNARRTAERVD